MDSRFPSQCLIQALLQLSPNRALASPGHHLSRLARLLFSWVATTEGQAQAEALPILSIMAMVDVLTTSLLPPHLVPPQVEVTQQVLLAQKLEVTAAAAPQGASSNILSTKSALISFQQFQRRRAHSRYAQMAHRLS